jgi:tRNA-specific 2-thiouridylase
MPARASVEEGRLRIDLEQPAQGVAPGQAAVFYDGTRVIGSATIDMVARRTGRAAATPVR